MKIYETKVEAGTKQWLKIPVDEECSLKAAAFCGSRPGKRLIVTAGVHGNSGSFPSDSGTGSEADEGRGCISSDC